jgi:hypothetical protein
MDSYSNEPLPFCYPQRIYVELCNDDGISLWTNLIPTLLQSY